MNKEYHPRLLVMLLILTLVLTAGCSTPGVDLYKDLHITGIASNPYDDIDWTNISYYDANLHSHTSLSDGTLDPHDVVDAYREQDYEILALTDHDKSHDGEFPETLYEWTRFSEIGQSLGYQSWEDRDPSRLGLVSVEGAEVSRAHHMNTFFCGFAGGHDDERQSLEAVTELDGLAVMNHPGRYHESVSFYLDLYGRYAHLIALEIFNRDDRYPNDRNLWDAVLYHMMPDRPVWGLGNDDMHIVDHIGFNRNVFLLQSLDHQDVRDGLEMGHWYLFRPESRTGRPDVTITSITSDETTITIAVDQPEKATVSWVSYDPIRKESAYIAEGFEFTVNEDVVHAIPYVRAEITTDSGMIYTQPFGLILE